MKNDFDKKDDVLTLWTVRPILDYDILLTQGVYRTCPSLVECHRLPAYEWMAKQLANQCPAPFGVQLPVWAWYHAHGSKKPKPDLRKTGHLPKGEKGVRIEFKISKELVLLSNFDAWHSVLNDWFLSFGDEEFEYYEKLQKRLSFEMANQLKQQTWLKIFDLSLIPKPQLYEIQAVFWELKLEQVSKVDFFIAR